MLQLHNGFADSATIFAAVLGIWALVLRFRSRTLDGAWYGAAVICMALIVLQAAIGLIMYMQGQNANLPRPFIHVLYGAVAVITLPASYAYLGNVEDENTKTVLMALVCLFLWAMLDRAATVAEFLPVVN